MVQVFQEFVIQHLGLLKRQRCIAQLHNIIIRITHYLRRENAHLFRSVHERRQFDLGQEPLQELGVEFRLSDLELHIFEREGEVVRVAVLRVAREEVVSDEADHGGRWRKERLPGPRASVPRFVRICKIAAEQSSFRRSSAQATPTMRPPSPSIPEREFLFSALKESQRLDGRMPLEMRAPVLTFGPDLGWVECAMGKTRYAQNGILDAISSEYSSFLFRVLAQVEGKMVKPQPERPFEGSLTIHSEISPMASSDYEPGR